MEIPRLTRAQMIEVDRVMVEDLGIQLMQMMENAGRNLAELAIRLFDAATVQVLAGSGGNGGGGLVAARHLANRGVDVAVTLMRNELSGVPGHQLDILRRMGVSIGGPRQCDVIIDALLGYSLSGPPRGMALEWIWYANESPGRKLALDVPSGVDVDTGEAPGRAINCDVTMTLALPKVGLDRSPLVGDLWLADISVPPSVYAGMGIEVPDGLFAKSTLVKLEKLD